MRQNIYIYIIYKILRIVQRTRKNVGRHTDRTKKTDDWKISSPLETTIKAPMFVEN